MRVSNRIRMEKGLFVPPSAPYGYRLKDKELEVIPEEAKIIKYIYCAFLSGEGKGDIAKKLNVLGIQKYSKSGKWHQGAIQYILINTSYQNEKMKKVKSVESLYRGRIFCATCGSSCRGKLINSKLYWICLKRNQSKSLCPIPEISDDKITTAIWNFYLKMKCGTKRILHSSLTYLREIQRT